MSENEKVKVGFFEGLRAGNGVVQDILKYGEDGRIDVIEWTVTASNLAENLGLYESVKELDALGNFAESLERAKADGKITVKEMIDIMGEVCKGFGINFDTTGVSVEDLPSTGSLDFLKIFETKPESP